MSNDKLAATFHPDPRLAEAWYQGFDYADEQKDNIRAREDNPYRKGEQ